VTHECMSSSSSSSSVVCVSTATAAAAAAAVIIGWVFIGWWGTREPLQPPQAPMIPMVLSVVSVVIQHPRLAEGGRKARANLPWCRPLSPSPQKNTHTPQYNALPHPCRAKEFSTHPYYCCCCCSPPVWPGSVPRQCHTLAGCWGSSAPCPHSRWHRASGSSPSQSRSRQPHCRQTGRQASRQAGRELEEGIHFLGDCGNQ
jgi:hypothetical protein